MILRKYYIMAPGGPSIKKTEEFILTRVIANQKRTELTEELGLKALYSDDRGVVHGASFSHMEIPIGWKRIKKDPHEMLRPNIKTPEGAKILVRFAECTIGQGMEFQSLFEQDTMKFCGCRVTDDHGRPNSIPIGFLIYEKVGEHVILSVPDMSVNEWKAPDDCAPLKTSEYYGLREAAGIVGK